MHAEATFLLKTEVFRTYAVLARVSPSCSPLLGRLPTRYSPVRHSTRGPKATFAFDLHVLGTPPAFILSQDQTLQLNPEHPVTGALFCAPSDGASYGMALSEESTTQNADSLSSIQFSKNRRPRHEARSDIGSYGIRPERVKVDLVASRPDIPPPTESRSRCGQRPTRNRAGGKLTLSERDAPVNGLGQRIRSTDSPQRLGGYPKRIRAALSLGQR